MAKRQKRFQHPAEAEQDVTDIKDAFTHKKKKQKYPQSVVQNQFWLKAGFSARTAGQAYYLQLLNECTITLCTGPAGTGKTWIATRFALEKMLSGAVSRIVVTKPILEAGSEKLGALPGEVEDKVLPHFQSILDCFEDHLGPAALKKLLDTDKITFIPTAYMRGRSLNNAFILVDESQNLTKKGLKLLLTRLAEGSLMCVNGDSDQCDLPRPEDSGFAPAIQALQGSDPEIGVATLDYADIQRHRLIGVMLSRLK